MDCQTILEETKDGIESLGGAQALMDPLSLLADAAPDRLDSTDGITDYQAIIEEIAGEVRPLVGQGRSLIIFLLWQMSRQKTLPCPCIRWMVRCLVLVMLILLFQFRVSPRL